MSPIKVWRGPYGDWMFTCATHNEDLTTWSWESAYEAAMGHVCLHHPTSTRKTHA